MLATALSERVADAIVLAVMSAIVLLDAAVATGWLAGAAAPVAISGLSGAAAIAVLPFLGPRAGRRSSGPAARRCGLGCGRHGQGLRGLRGFHDGRRLSAFSALAVLIWVLDAAGTVIGGAALGLRHPACGRLPAHRRPEPGQRAAVDPGYIGIYQFVAVSVLTPFGFSRADAIAFILVTQALGYVVIWLLGLPRRFGRDRLNGRRSQAVPHDAELTENVLC